MTLVGQARLPLSSFLIDFENTHLRCDNVKQRIAVVELRSAWACSTTVTGQTASRSCGRSKGNCASRCIDGSQSVRHCASLPALTYSILRVAGWTRFGSPCFGYSIDRLNLRCGLTAPQLVAQEAVEIIWMPEVSASESGRLRQEPISDVVVDALRTDTKYLGGISFGQRLERCDRHLQNIAGGDVLSSQLFYPSLDSGNGTATCGVPSPERHTTSSRLPPRSRTQTVSVSGIRRRNSAASFPIWTRLR